MIFHSFNNHKRAWRVILMLNLAFMYLFGSTFPVYAANDFVTTELRVDLSSVNQARDYLHTLFVGGTPSTGSSSDYTAAWISVNLADGGANGRKFTQVGFLTSKSGVRWFVYSGAGVTCFQGSPAWGNLGCVGNFGDRATIGHWQNVELVTYGQGFWIARVYDQNGNALDVAKILYNSLTIYRATAVTEEAYPESTDPFILASFWHNHPKYMVWGTGFQNWPASSGGHNNYLFASPSSICPTHYIARLNWFGNDPRIWYAGSAGPTPASCSANPIF